MSDESDETSIEHEAPDGAGGSERLTAPADPERQPRLPFPVVGVGASAGGLEAYIELLDAMPADSGMALVLVQHLSPGRESLVADILAAHTLMPVRQVDDGMIVEPDSVYVIRPGHTLTIREGRLRLGQPVEAPGHNRPVDDFFRSLAEEQQHRAIAVVLSGMGSNGTAGAQAVKTVGGLCIAQDPVTAKFPSMPRSLIDTRTADCVLRAAEIPEAIIRYASHPYAAGKAEPGEQGARRAAHTLAEILTIVRARTRHEFGGCRKPTLIRRIQRRMGLNQIEDMGEYVRTLRQSFTEVTALADDLLIHVTGFFRDPDAWEALRHRVIEPLVAERPEGSAIRAWVTACATGEEAYSLAMLLVEAAEARGKRFDIKVFATDMAERALGHARSGVFPGGIESEVTSERLERFFDKDDSMYRVKQELRELVVFAPQNLLQDPPFSRLDIASCRNLLIYLEPEVQRRVISLLHFGLREGGTLMLGGSESVGVTGDEFEPIDKKHRLFRRIGPTRHGSMEFPPPNAALRESLRNRNISRAGQRHSLGQMVNRTLLEHHTPAAVVVDRQGQILYYHGDTGRYLSPPRGEPTNDLLALADDHLRGAIRMTLHLAISQEKPAVIRDGLFDTPEGRRRAEVSVLPLDLRPAQAAYLVVFTDHAEPAPPPADPSADVGELGEALRRVRDELQSTVEELQTSNEEMKASNEEVTSINEELQSANEELETSKEELQSLNEELTTVNAQLQAKMDELEKTGNDLGSLLASTDIAVIFLDTRFRIRRYTPAVRDLFDLIPSDAGRPLADLRRKFADAELLPDARAVLDRLIPVERQVTSETGRIYVRRTLPYRTADNRIDGVVITFVDITERARVEEALRNSEERFRAIVDQATVGVVYTDLERRITFANERFGDITGYAPAELIGRHMGELAHPDDVAMIHERLERLMAAGLPFDIEKRYLRKDRSIVWVHNSVTFVRDATGRPKACIVLTVDISRRMQSEESLRKARDELESRVTERTHELAEVNESLRAVGRAREAAEAGRFDLLRRFQNVQEEERRRVARELHDQVGQTLTALTLALQAVLDDGPLPKGAAAKLGEVKRAADELGRDIHTIAVRLRPTALDDLGLTDALTQLLAVWSSRSGVAYDLETTGIAEVRFSPEVETIIYRVVQEALTNVARHAEASHVSVVVERHGRQAVAVVEDNGIGFDPETANRGRLGLIGMRERVALAGGTIVIESSPGNGTTVIVRLPLETSAPPASPCA